MGIARAQSIEIFDDAPEPIHSQFKCSGAPVCQLRSQQEIVAAQCSGCVWCTVLVWQGFCLRPQEVKLYGSC